MLRKNIPALVFLALFVAFLFIWIEPTHRLVVQAQAPNGQQLFHQAAAGTYVVRNGFGYLYSVSINGGTGGVVSVYDIASSGCTATPASGLLAAIASTTAPVTVLGPGGSVKNGLCVVLAAATDVTVSWN
jgi:hypothetical protein